MWSTALEYLQLPIAILQKGVTESGKQLLTAAAVDTMIADQTRGAIILYSPYMQYRFLDPTLPSIRYGVGVWREGIDAASGVVKSVSSQGKFGFSPWVDFDLGYAAVLAVKSDLSAVYPTYFRLRQLLWTILSSPTEVESLPRSPQIEISPNPVSSLLYLRSIKPIRATIQDLLGRVVWEGEVLGSGSIDVSRWKSGVYFVRAGEAGKKIIVATR